MPPHWSGILFLFFVVKKRLFFLTSFIRCNGNVPKLERFRNISQSFGTFLKSFESVLFGYHVGYEFHGF